MVVGSHASMTGFRLNTIVPLSMNRCRKKNPSPEQQPQHQPRAGAGGAHRSEYEGNRQQHGEGDGAGTRDARPECEQVWLRIQRVGPVVADQTPQRAAGEFPRLRHGQIQELPADIGIKRPHALGGRRDPLGRKARLGIAVQHPAMIRPGHRVRRAPHRQQVMIRRQLEYQHAAVRPPVLRLLNVQDLVAVAHPGGPAAEAGVGKALERFLLTCDLLAAGARAARPGSPPRRSAVPRR